MHIIKREWAACPCCNTVRRLYLISADRRTEEMNDFDAGKKTISGQNYGPQQIPPGFQTQGPAPGGGFQPAAPENIKISMSNRRILTKRIERCVILITVRRA